MSASLVLSSSLRRFRDGAKATFASMIDPEEHVRGFASVGDQEEGVANARQEFCGHYLDLCATYWHLDGLECAREYGRRVVDGAARAIDDDGYIGGEVKERRMEGFSLWNQSHAVYGLLRFAEAANDDRARALGLRAAEWLLRALSSISPMELVDSAKSWNDGSQHLVAFYALCLAHEATGERKYLDHVRETLRGLETTKMNLLSNPDCLALQSKKGIEMINAWRGVLKYARLAGDDRVLRACTCYWRSIADTQIRNTGAATNAERFFPGGNAPAILTLAEKPNENCVQCGWLRFSRELFAATGDVRCAHEMEKTLYNHILGSIASDGSDFAYYQGNVGRKAFRKNAVYQCCRYRGFAIMAHLPELVIHDDGAAATPLVYAPLSYRAPDGLSLEIATEYPKDGRIGITATAKSLRTIRLPIPPWCREWTLRVNGKEVLAKAIGGFAVVELQPLRETSLSLDLRMEFARKPCVIDGGRYSEFSYGPLVLVRDTGLGDSLGEALPDGLSFERQDCGDEAFAKFAATDGGGRRHHLVDYAHACRSNPDANAFEVFVPLRSRASRKDDSRVFRVNAPLSR